MLKTATVSAIIILTVFSFTANSIITSNNHHHIFQAGTITTLSQGVYDGSYPISKLPQHGNFGLGTFNSTDGEMIMLDSKIYQLLGESDVVIAADDLKTPFATIVNFRGSKERKLRDITNFKELEAKMVEFFENKNVPFAIRLDGDFEEVKLRTLVKQTPPYKNLSETSKEQISFSAKNTQGTLIGYWFPKHLSEINVPGLHLHYLSYDVKNGGHVLDAKFKVADVAIDPIYSFEVNFPLTQNFREQQIKAQAQSKEFIGIQ